MGETNYREELRRRLADLPKTDRGFSWQLRNWNNRHELNVYGDTAATFKWILDNAEAITDALRVDAVGTVVSVTVAGPLKRKGKTNG